MRRGVGNTTAVELGALHFVLSVDSLLWCADFAVDWHSSDAFHLKVPGMIQICYTASTYVAAMEELARQIRIFVVVCSDPGKMSWSDSRFFAESHRAGDALVPVPRRHVARQIYEFRETEPSQRR